MANVEIGRGIPESAQALFGERTSSGMSELSQKAEAKDMKLARTADVVAAEINALTASMLNNVIEIGRRMVEAKERLPHGAFGDWIREKTGYSVSTANNFMLLYREYGAAQSSLFGAEANSQTIGKLSYTKALALLAVPAEERESFAAEHHVEDMSTSELKQAIKDREEALAEKKAAKEAWEKMAADMERANKRIEQLNADLKDRDEDAAAAEAEVERLAAELKKLQERPIDVAVQVDQAAIDAAEKRGADRGAEQEREAGKAKLDELQKQLDKAKEAKQKAEEKRKAAEDALEEAKAKLALAETAQKEAAISNDKELAEFKVYFDQAKEAANKLRGLLLKARGREDQELAEKLQKAMIALGENIGRAAE